MHGNLIVNIYVCVCVCVVCVCVVCVCVFVHVISSSESWWSLIAAGPAAMCDVHTAQQIASCHSYVDYE